VRLDMLLQVLGTLEGFATEVALVRLQGDVDSDVRGDVVTLDGRSTTVAPLTGQIEVVGALTANMALAHVILRSLLAGGVVETKATCRARQSGWHAHLHRGVRRCRIVRRSLATGR